MSRAPNALDAPEPREVFAVRIQGHLPPRWSAWFEEMTVSLEEDGVTLLMGPVIDQAALHGLLSKVRDLGLHLISITRIECEPKP
jgi:hypothetical protein